MATVPKWRWFKVFNFVSTLLTLLAETFFNKKSESSDSSEAPTPTEEVVSK